MPLFGGKKKENVPILNKPKVSKYKEYSVPGPTSGSAFCSIQGKEAMIASALDARGLMAMSVMSESDEDSN